MVQTQSSSPLDWTADLSTQCPLPYLLSRSDWCSKKPLLPVSWHTHTHTHILGKMMMQSHPDLLSCSYIHSTAPVFPQVRISRPTFHHLKSHPSLMLWWSDIFSTALRKTDHCCPPQQAAGTSSTWFHKHDGQILLSHDLPSWGIIYSLQPQLWSSGAILIYSVRLLPAQWRLREGSQEQHFKQLLHLNRKKLESDWTHFNGAWNL